MIVSVAELMPWKLPARNDLASPDRVVAIGLHPVVAAAAVDVVAPAADRVDHVVARARLHHVGPRPGAELVAAAAAAQDVVARVALEEVVAVAAVDEVRTAAPVERVVARAAADLVGRGGTRLVIAPDEILARGAVEEVGTRAAEQLVVALAADAHVAERPGQEDEPGGGIHRRRAGLDDVLAAQDLPRAQEAPVVAAGDGARRVDGERVVARPAVDLRVGRAVVRPDVVVAGPGVEDVATGAADEAVAA